MSLSFELAQAFLNRSVTVVIDRPLGSVHPKHGFTYPVNYGYVPETKAPDGEELDAYVLGVSEAVERFEGRCIAVIHRKDDDDDKLIVVSEGIELDDAAILAAVQFQEQWFQSVVLR